jgi:hypothetical protein
MQNIYESVDTFILADKLVIDYNRATVKCIDSAR